MRHSLRAVSLWWLIVLVPIMAGAAVRNKRPIAENDAATTAVNTRVPIKVTDNDSDRDGRIMRKTVLIVGAGPRIGKAAVKRRNGTVIYTPKRGFSGRDTFRYQVEDNRGALSNKARVRVTVGPVADAGPDRNAVTGIPVILNGSTTFDPDSNTLGYSWRFLSVPSASARTSADIVNPASPAPSFTPDVDGNYELEFTVTDGTLSDTDGVVITAAAVVINSLEDDTGPSPFDFITKDTEPKLIGTAATSISEVTLYENGTPVLPAAPVNNDGTWSYDLFLDEGDHTFTATGKNAFGQESSPSASQKVTVDATAPTKPSFPVNAGCFVSKDALKDASIEEPVLVPLVVDPLDSCIELGSSLDGGIPDRVVLHKVKDNFRDLPVAQRKIGEATKPYRVRDGFRDGLLRMEITDKLPVGTYHYKFFVIDVAGNESCVATFVVDPEDPEDEDYGCVGSENGFGDIFIVGE